MEKKTERITITLDRPTFEKLEQQAQEERRPLGQLAGLIVADYINPQKPAQICEQLEIFRNGEKVNELKATGTPAALELVKLFMWKYNDPKSAKIWEVINPTNGLHEIKATYKFSGADSIYCYEYYFTGQAVENLPIF